MHRVARSERLRKLVVTTSPPERSDDAQALRKISTSSCCSTPLADTPAGADLRQDFTPQSPYFRLRDARAEARAEEREADKNADRCRRAAAMAGGARACAGNVRRAEQGSRNGRLADRGGAAARWIARLRGRTLLMDRLVEQFWDHLYPRPDEEGMETRVAPVTGLNGLGRRRHADPAAAQAGDVQAPRRHAARILGIRAVGPSRSIEGRRPQAAP